jgi:hypothetical protein
VVQIDSQRSVVISTDKVEIIGNLYIRNFGGFGQGLVEIRGMTQVDVLSENFTRNGENTAENIV